MFEERESGNKEQQEEDLLSWVSHILMPHTLFFNFDLEKEERKGRLIYILTLLLFLATFGPANFCSYGFFLEKFNWHVNLFFFFFLFLLTKATLSSASSSSLLLIKPHGNTPF
jgi:hypothetical protein